jgi:hypothetical protein
MTTQQGTNTVAEAAAPAKEVAHEAASQAKAVATEAKEQVREVASDVKAQAEELVHRTQDGLRNEAQSRTQQAADSLRTLGSQMEALRNGDTDRAGPVLRYVDEAQRRVSTLADRLQQRGFQGLVDDVSSFARRRPGLFLAACAGTGFVVTRLVRMNGMSNGSEASRTATETPRASYREADGMSERQRPMTSWQPQGDGMGRVAS